MHLDVPYIPDSSYVNLLSRHEQRIHSLHFALPGAPTYDARTFGTGSTDPYDFIEGLKAFPRQKKHLLLNGRFQNPACYFRGPELKKLITSLEFWVEHAGINGIILADMYLLTTLSNEAPDLAQELQAIPSVNCMIDNADKALSFLELIASTRFRMPELIILDRSLNRAPLQLEQTSHILKDHHPRMHRALLANEGCLYQCPFKLAHDSQASLINTGLMRENMFCISRERGCIPCLQKHPQAILKSPFIRPEDQDAYTPHADILKICGRTMGPEFLIRTVSAYLEKSFNGNLLSLLDATDWMADHFNISNARFPQTFLQTLTGCSKICSTCDYCHDLFSRISRPILGKPGQLG
ncbi:MAG: hypothetical protein PHO79_05220 [Desulfoplanes sp.]|nr:hypothetical protein [Desulfoplanes sp.]